MPLRSALPSSLVRCWMTGAQVLGVQQRQVRWSAQWKISPSVDSWVSLRSSTLRQQDRAELRQRGADRRSPSSCRPGDRNSTGYAVGVQSSPVSFARASDLGRCPRRARPCPDRSPLTSASSTGHARVRQLPGDPLQRLRLARAGGAGDEAVPVERRERDADPRRRVDLPVDDDGAQLQCPALASRTRQRSRCAASVAVFVRHDAVSCSA